MKKTGLIQVQFSLHLSNPLNGKLKSGAEAPQDFFENEQS